MLQKTRRYQLLFTISSRLGCTTGETNLFANGLPVAMDTTGNQPCRGHETKKEEEQRLSRLTVQLTEETLFAKHGARREFYGILVQLRKFTKLCSI